MARKIIKAGVKKVGRGLRSGKAKIDPVKDLKADMQQAIDQL